MVLEPLDFVARLASLVPRPRLNLTRFHGVFAPNFKLRPKIVPRRARVRVDADKPFGTDVVAALAHPCAPRHRDFLSKGCSA